MSAPAASGWWHRRLPMLPTGARRALTLVLGAAVAALVIAHVSRGMRWEDARRLLQSASPAWLALAVALDLLVPLCWGVAWWWFQPRAERVTVGRMVQVTAATAMAMTVVPAGGGHVSAFVLLRRAGASTGGAATVLALDQVAEGTAKLGLALAALLLVPAWMLRGVLPASGPALALLLGVILAALALAGALVWRAGRRREVDAPRSRAGRIARGIVERTVAAARDWRAYLAGLAAIGLLKLAELGAIVAVLHAFDARVAPGVAVLALLATQIATLVGITPGNLGVYEAAALLVYRQAGLPPEVGLSVAVAQHLCLLVGLVVPAVLVLAVRAMRA